MLRPNHHHVLTVALNALRPTQASVGYVEVSEKRQEWQSLKSAQRAELLNNHWFPAVLGYSLLGYDSCLKGLGKLEADAARMAKDLNQAWEVLAEPIQTVMRKAGVDNAYDRLKDLTRGNVIDEALIRQFIATLPIPEEDRQRLLVLTPATYIGLAATLAKKITS